MKSNENKPLSEIITEGFKTAISEAEELRVQLALGKMEARDLFEDLKKNAVAEIRQAKQNLQSLKSNPEVLRILNAFEHLQVQFALEKAESAEMFDEQRRKISAAMNELENLMKNDSELKEELGQIKLMIEKFRLKLELVALKFRLKKVSTEFSIGELKKDLLDKANNLRHQLAEKEKQASARWEHFSSEINNAFDHIRKAFNS